jgi:PAS domain S-box-containing protein
MPKRPPSPAEKALARQLHLFRKAAEVAPGSIVITDADGVVEWVNRAFTRASGYAFDEAIGWKLGSLIGSGEQDRAFYREFWDTIQDGRVWTGELINRRKDGSLYPEKQTVTPVTDDEGRVTHFIAAKVDVSEQEQASERVSEGGTTRTPRGI